MSAIVFFKTRNLEIIRNFYLDQLDCRLWLDQGDCLIFRHGNQLLGFCQSETVDTDSLITFFYQSKADIDRIYEQFRSSSISAPAMNEKYGIYHFFARDPEGRTLEFQYFDQALPGFLNGDEILLTRRSIRKFRPDIIPAEVLDQILEICRFAPTSKNSQSYYFKFIEDAEIRLRVSEVREKSSSSIARAPLAVAICSDPELSLRHIQDGCIAAYHFILTARYFGLGTCWIAAMDREDVKRMLDIPQEHYIATITPLGYPLEQKTPPERHERGWFVR